MKGLRLLGTFTRNRVKKTFWNRLFSSFFCEGCSSEDKSSVGREGEKRQIFLSLAPNSWILRVLQVVLVVKTLPANVGDIRDLDWIPGLGRSSGGGRGNLLQYPCLENPMDRAAWQATVHEVAKSRTRLKRLSTKQFCVMTPSFALCPLRWSLS